MDEFTDFENIDLEELSGIVIDNFCERYMEEAMRVIHTGVILPSDMEMLRLSTGLVVGMYLKRLAEETNTGKRTTH